MLPLNPPSCSVLTWVDSFAATPNYGRVSSENGNSDAAPERVLDRPATCPGLSDWRRLSLLMCLISASPSAPCPPLPPPDPRLALDLKWPAHVPTGGAQTDPCGSRRAASLQRLSRWKRGVCDSLGRGESGRGGMWGRGGFEVVWKVGLGGNGGKRGSGKLMTQSGLYFHSFWNGAGVMPRIHQGFSLGRGSNEEERCLLWEMGKWAKQNWSGRGRGRALTYHRHSRAQPALLLIL